MANYLPIEKRKQIFHLLVEGNGLRSITRIVDCSTNTVQGLQIRYSPIIDYLNRKYINNLVMPEIEADEIRTYVLNKKNVRWVYIALDRKSRMVIHFHIGSRDANDAEIFLSGLSDKLSEVSKVSTDCLTSYVAAVNKTRTWNDRYSTEAIDLQRARYLGKTLGMISNHIEKHNGTVRQHVSKLARKTRCFAKNDTSLWQHLNLFFFYYNFIKKSKAVKTVPAVAAKLIDKPLIIEDIIEYDLMLMDKANSNKRGTYKKHSVSKEDKLLFLKVVDELKSEVKLRIA